MPLEDGCLNCSEIAELFTDVVDSHCDSCHEDADSHGYELLELVLPDGRRALVCCHIHAKVKAHFATQT